MSKLRNLEIKKLMKEYDFLLLDSEYKTEFIEKHKPEFLERIAKIRGEMGVEPPAPEISTEAEKKEKEEGFKVDKDTKNKAKKLYRDIVKITHPDKTDDESLTEIYVKATKYYEEYNVLELTLICIDLDIETDLSDFNIEDLEKIVNAKREQLQGLEKSYLWLWVNAANDELKDNIVRAFIKING
jgi:hypothetical protein